MPGAVVGMELGEHVLVSLSLYLGQQDVDALENVLDPAVTSPPSHSLSHLLGIHHRLHALHRVI